MDINLKEYITNYPINRLSRIDYINISPKEVVSSDHKGKLKGNSLHTVELYEYPIKGDIVYVKWAYCRDCHKIRHQYLIAFDNISRTGFVRDIIENGEYVS